MTKRKCIIRYFSWSWGLPLRFHFLPPCISGKTRYTIIIVDLLVKFHLSLVLCSQVAPLRWLFGWIGKHYKLLSKLLTSYISIAIIVFFLALTSISCPSKCCKEAYISFLSHEYIIVCPPLLLSCQLLPSIILSLPTC